MESSSTLGTEFEFIKEQIHLYRSAIYQFVIINTQAQQPFSEYDLIQSPEYDHLKALIEALDTFGLETSIKIILMEKDAKNLSSFLKSSFIDPFINQVAVLREVAKFELSEYETGSENKQLRLYQASQLYAVYEKINEIINNIFPDYFQSRLNAKQKENLTSELKNWILPDFVDKFTEIEKELFQRGYIDSQHKWRKQKTKFAEFIYVIIKYKYLKTKIEGKIKKDFHKRHFLSLRYGYAKTGLSDTWTKHQHKMKQAEAAFTWIKKPE